MPVPGTKFLLTLKKSDQSRGENRPKRTTLTFVFRQSFLSPDGYTKWRKQPQFNALWRALGEGDSCRIFAIESTFERIVLTSKKGGFCGDFPGRYLINGSRFGGIFMYVNDFNYRIPDSMARPSSWMRILWPGGKEIRAESEVKIDPCWREFVWGVMCINPFIP